MSFEMMKKAVIGAAGAVVLMGATAVHAADAEVWSAGSEIGNTNSISGSFSGTTTLKYSFFPDITCPLTLSGDVIDNGDSVTINVTSGVIGAGTLCDVPSLSFANGPWTATIQGNDLVAKGAVTGPVGGTFTNVQVSPCGGSSIAVDFDNNGTAGVLNSGASAFTFTNATLGACTVTGTLTITGTDIDAVGDY